MLRVNFMINGLGPDADEAIRIMERFDQVMRQCNLSGNTKGVCYENFANYCGNYSDRKKDNDCDDGKDHDHKDHKD